MRIKQKTAIVTGGGSGLGRAIAHRLAGEGATVVVADLNAASSRAVVEEIHAAGGAATAYQVDVTDRVAIAACVEHVVSTHGRIDILVNNAGITRYRPYHDLSDADWDAVLGLDLKGVFFCTQAVSPLMVAQRYGKIVNISSSIGTGTTPHIANCTAGASAPYASAKAAVIQLTKTLARELGPHGINVNCVAPGFFLTPLTSAVRNPEEVAEHIAVRVSTTLLNRPGRLEELADAVLFMASDESSFITGHTLVVDGGRTDRL